LQVEGDTTAFVEDLRLEGVQVLTHRNGSELRVVVPDGWTARGFFTLAQHRGLVVRGLQRDDEDLEELFHRVIQENGADGT
jgi:hypothetical protein